MNRPTDGETIEYFIAQAEQMLAQMKESRGDAETKEVFGAKRVVMDGAVRGIDWSEYPNFNQWEFACKCGCGRCEIKEEVVAMCQDLRDEIGRPIGITSGYRCPAHNKSLEKIGASKSSGHMDGTEVDISAIDSSLRYSILAFAFERGVKRVGARYKSFIHLGLSETLPQEVSW